MRFHTSLVRCARLEQHRSIIVLCASGHSLAKRSERELHDDSVATCCVILMILHLLGLVQYVFHYLEQSWENACRRVATS